MFKKALISALCLYMVMISVTSTLSFAGSNENIESQDLIVPYMNYISGTNLRLSKNQSGRAEVYCRVTGYLGITTKINTTTSLQQYKNGVWQTIRKFDESVNSHSITLNKEVPVEKGYSYRVTTLVRAYSGERFEVQVLRSKEMKF